MSEHYAESWREEAACLGYPDRRSDPWFTRDKARNEVTQEPARRSRDKRTAIAFCQVCPVTAQCLTYALAYERDHPQRQHFGIYGGTTPLERRHLLHESPGRKAS